MSSKRALASLLRAATVAVSAVSGLAVFPNSAAHGAMSVGLFAISKNGAALSGGDDAHDVLVQTGDVVRFVVYADVTQSDVIGNPPTGAGWPVFSSAAGDLRTSTGGSLANFSAASNVLEPATAAGTASSRGFTRDLDGDGDLDIAGTDPTQPNSGYVLYRTALDNAECGPNSTTAAGSPGGVPNAFQPGFTPVPISGGFRYFLSMRVDLTVADDGGGASSTVFWKWRPTPPGFAGLMFEGANEIRTETDPGVFQVTYFGGHEMIGGFGVGESVTLHSVPEPSATLFAAGGLVAFALLERRRKPAEVA